MNWWNAQKERLKRLFDEYGKLALITHLSIFALVLGSFWIALSAGADIEAAGNIETAGVFGAAYVATQLTKPVRIALTVVLTPLIARLLRRQPDTIAP